MARNNRNTNRPTMTQQSHRGGGGWFLGLLIGLIIGLAFAAGLAWYIYTRPSDLRRPEHVPEPQPIEEVAPTIQEGGASGTPQPAQQNQAPPVIPPSAPAQAPAPPNFSFYDILPGEKPSTPNEPETKLPREVWWLQVAALRDAKDADRLKAKLALLGLSAQVQNAKGDKGVLYRVRVGPYKTEDAALGALDTLSANKYEPRLFKEAVDKP
jgi:cell division protein FtsN